MFACQPAVTCLKLKIETLKQGVNQICSKLTIKIPCYSTPCSSVSIVNFEQLNAGWFVSLDINMI